jgi:hypothetical protein
MQPLDQLFAAGLEGGTSFVMPSMKRNPLGFGDEDAVDGAF